MTILQRADSKNVEAKLREVGLVTDNDNNLGVHQEGVPEATASTNIQPSINGSSSSKKKGLDPNHKIRPATKNQTRLQRTQISFSERLKIQTNLQIGTSRTLIRSLKETRGNMVKIWISLPH